MQTETSRSLRKSQSGCCGEPAPEGPCQNIDRPVHADNHTRERGEHSNQEDKSGQSMGANAKGPYAGDCKRGRCMSRWEADGRAGWSDDVNRAIQYGGRSSLVHQGFQSTRPCRAQQCDKNECPNQVGTSPP